DDVLIIGQHQGLSQLLTARSTAFRCPVADLDGTHLLHIDDCHAFDRIRNMPTRTRHGGLDVLAELQYHATGALVDDIESGSEPDQGNEADDRQHRRAAEITRRRLTTTTSVTGFAENSIELATKIAQDFVQIWRATIIAITPTGIVCHTLLQKH